MTSEFGVAVPPSWKRPVEPEEYDNVRAAMLMHEVARAVLVAVDEERRREGPVKTPMTRLGWLRVVLPRRPEPAHSDRYWTEMLDGVRPMQPQHVATLVGCLGRQDFWATAKFLQPTLARAVDHEDRAFAAPKVEAVGLGMSPPQVRSKVRVVGRAG